MAARRLLLALVLALAACATTEDSGDAVEVRSETGAASETLPIDATGAAALSGDGMVVWESNRSGAWRLWTRRLDGSGLRQLTADEAGRSHCCPHLAPDGSRVAYLSVEPRRREYPGPRETGELRLVGLDDSGERSLGVGARTYFENRAVVWRSSEELIFIDAEGRSQLLDLESGKRRSLVDTGSEAYGWLIDSTLSWSVSGEHLFGRYDRDRRRVIPGREQRGCQPYFTRDGRWGFWMPAPGGPIEAVELASGEARTIVQKNDRRLPSGLGYLYFPMFSADRRMLAFAASADDHDHFRADYEIFVAPTDPETLELIGVPIRLTTNPATDRYPDVYLSPLALGRLSGEAPFSVRLRPESPAGEWRWDFGSGATARAAVGEHTFDRPGSYDVVARLGGAVLQGHVTVVPPAAPRVLNARLVGLGDAVRIDFDEPVTLEEPRFDLASATRIEQWRLSSDGRALTLELADRLRRGDTLRLAGVVDRAQKPNRMAPTELELAPPLWPSRRDNLVFLWESADAANLVYDAALEADRTSLLESRGRARLDRDYAMVLAGGAFAAPAEQARALRLALQATNELTIELTLTSNGGDGRIASLSNRNRGEDFWLEETSGRIVFGLRGGNREPEGVGRIAIAPVEPGRRIHLVVTYAPGRLRAFVDGARVAASDALQGGFFHWRSDNLTFGDKGPGGADWSGRIEGIAIYDRALSEQEIRENFLRLSEKIEARRRPPRLIVEARLRQLSSVPTLADITPYREALAVFEYEVEQIVSGELEGSVLRVADWVIADGERLGLPAVGATSRLVLEPFASQPQLESVYLANSLPPVAGGLTLFYAVAE